MELSGSYFLFISILILLVINIFTSREILLYPFIRPYNKVIIFITVWLLPVIGLFIAYKVLHLDAPLDSTGGGNGTQHYPNEDINDVSDQ